MVNVYERISEWLVECPVFDGYLYFNVIPVENGNSSLNSKQLILIKLIPNLLAI